MVPFIRFKIRSVLIHSLFIIDMMNRLYLNHTIELDHLKNLQIFQIDFFLLKTIMKRNDV